MCIHGSEKETKHFKEWGEAYGGSGVRKEGRNAIIKLSQKNPHNLVEIRTVKLYPLCKWPYSFLISFLDDSEH